MGSRFPFFEAKGQPLAEEEVRGVRGREMRSSGDLEGDLKVGRGPMRQPSLGPKAAGREGRPPGRWGA